MGKYRYKYLVAATLPFEELKLKLSESKNVWNIFFGFESRRKFNAKISKEALNFLSSELNSHSK